ncbi:MAG TPA: hypothetical protein VMF69_21250 [Gemmataceae bacterium]|nr:hypothetical protein [Gemmataceae bacterium]
MARQFVQWADELAGKGIVGYLDENGVITFVIEAGERSPIRGTELFDNMMRSFGDEAKAIRGVWRVGTNLDKVNELTAQGLLLEEAVQYAWTVTRARRLGFSKVAVVLQEGQSGQYAKIDVLIEK